MGIDYKIFYKREVRDIDLPKINKKELERIGKSIQNKLTKYPEIYGKPLRFSLMNYKSFRVGKYRVIFEIKNQKMIVLTIGHRKNVYELARKRVVLN